MALLDVRRAVEDNLLVSHEEWISESWDFPPCYGLSLGLEDAYDAR